MLKVLNFRNTGVLSIVYRADGKDVEYALDYLDPILSEGVQSRLTTLLESLQSEGALEIHYEVTSANQFTHKVIVGDMIASDTVDGDKISLMTDIADAIIAAEEIAAAEIAAAEIAAAELAAAESGVDEDS